LGQLRINVPQFVATEYVFYKKVSLFYTIAYRRLSAQPFIFFEVFTELFLNNKTVSLTDFFDLFRRIKHFILLL